MKRSRVLRPIEYVMRRLQVSRESVERLMASGELAYHDLATHMPSGRSSGARTWRLLRFRPEDVDALIARRRRVDGPAQQLEAPAPLNVVRRPAHAVGHLKGTTRYA